MRTSEILDASAYLTKQHALRAPNLACREAMPEKETRQEKQLRKLGIESESAHAHRWRIYYPSNMHEKNIGHM
eukprot:Skav229873  [mRNA]  locus=scaffold247:171601:175700:+ [translate_table: standard]